MTRTTGFLVVALSGACFGALGVFAGLAYAAGADAASLLFLRFTLAGLILAGAMGVRRQRLPSRKMLLSLIGLGAVFYVSEAGAYFVALQHAPAGLVALLLYSFPALVALLQRFFFHERLGRVKWLAVAMALGGTVLTADLSQGGAKPLGVMLGLLSALLYAVYVVLSAKVAGQAGPLASSTIILCSAGASLGLLVLARGPAFPTTATGWGAVVALALVSTVAAVLLFFVGMARIGPVNTSLVSTMEPLTAVVLSAIFLGERLSTRQMLGGLLILTAAVMLARADASQPEAAGPTKGGPSPGTAGPG
ncbi:DMT family transporter [Pyxidicoccus xibeiensis]|uniref:DMT family transporter n=1 Tax=Pyxidicoccus xibeiensis TaxID=2906759 RepID=UPI0020A6EEE7|nr:EamA family transporter [Pyxidicoccus xibeiensis]MCP3136824.1 EamA family transporter [Pyxidicoccus xibeiensis]